MFSLRCYIDSLLCDLRNVLYISSGVKHDHVCEASCLTKSTLLFLSFQWKNEMICISNFCYQLYCTYCVFPEAGNVCCVTNPFYVIWSCPNLTCYNIFVKTSQIYKNVWTILVPAPDFIHIKYLAIKSYAFVLYCKGTVTFFIFLVKLHLPVRIALVCHSASQWNQTKWIMGGTKKTVLRWSPVKWSGGQHSVQKRLYEHFQVWVGNWVLTCGIWMRHRMEEVCFLYHPFLPYNQKNDTCFQNGCHMGTRECM